MNNNNTYNKKKRRIKDNNDEQENQEKTEGETKMVKGSFLVLMHQAALHFFL